MNRLNGMGAFWNADGLAEEAGFLRGMTPLKEESRKVSITRRGASAACSGALLAALAGISGDIAIGAAGVAAIAGVAAELVGSSARSKKVAAGGLVKKEREKGKSRLTSIAGETVELSVDVETPPRMGEVELFAADPPFEVVGFERTQGGYTVDLKAKPEVYGDYALGRLWATTGSRLGFFQSRVSLVRAGGEVGVGGEKGVEEGEGAIVEADGAIAALRVYPRFYPLMLEALSLLGEGALEGDVSASRLRRLGRGEEYAWSREYEPWDSPRFIDWKATARRGRLSVKEFFEDSGGRGAALFLDGRAPGRRSADEMARDLLSAVLGLAGGGRRVVMFVERGDGSHRKVEGSAEEVLRAALGEVFEIMVGADPEIFALFPPAVRSSLLRAMRMEEERGAGDGSAVGGKNARWEAVRMARAGRIGELVYVGCPLHGASEAIGMISEVASCGARVTALMPTKPWLDAPNLEEAYEARVSWERILRAIENATGFPSPMNYPVYARGT